MHPVEMQETLREITSDLKSLVEINKTQTERLLDNTRTLERLYTRQIALEKAVSSVLSPSQRSYFHSVFEKNMSLQFEEA